MKIKVTYTEHITYIHEKEMEVTKEEYLELMNNKNGKFYWDVKCEMDEECGDECFDSKEVNDLEIELIK
tara:strand:- start:2244 stop:2450 length:207 start_codon:yes stop_codon:yes gene_type:complete